MQTFKTNERHTPTDPVRPKNSIRINENKYIPTHIRVQLLKTKDRKKKHEACRKIPVTGTNIKLIIYFLQKEWKLQILKGGLTSK